MAETTITKKGQIVIPAPIRKEHNFKAGQKFLVIDEKEQIVLKPLRSLTLEEARGWLRTKKSTKELLKEARKENTKHEIILEQRFLKRKKK